GGKGKRGTDGDVLEVAAKAKSAGETVEHEIEDEAALVADSDESGDPLDALERQNLQEDRRQIADLKRIYLGAIAALGLGDADAPAAAGKELAQVVERANALEQQVAMHMAAAQARPRKPRAPRPSTPGDVSTRVREAKNAAGGMLELMRIMAKRGQVTL